MISLIYRNPKSIKHRPQRQSSQFKIGKKPQTSNLKPHTDNKAQYHTAHYTKDHQPKPSSKEATLPMGNKNSPNLPKALASIPNPTARTSRPIAALLLLRRIPRLHRFWDSSRLVRSVPRESRGDGAVENVAGDCGVESGGLGLVSS
jgi:hypothetical protein